MKTLLIEGLDLQLCSLRLANFQADEFGENRVHIHTVEAKVKGGGRKAMEIICKNADKLGIVLSLNAVPMVSTLYPEAWNIDSLIKWYENFGFKKARPLVVVDTSHMMPSHTSSLWLHMNHLLCRQT